MAASSALSPSCHLALPLLSHLQIPITVIKDPAAYFLHESSETPFVVASSLCCIAGIVRSEESGDGFDPSHPCLFLSEREEITMTDKVGGSSDEVVVCRRHRTSLGS